MRTLDQMNPSELEALATELHAQIRGSAGYSAIREIELKDVKDWIASRQKEAEPCLEPSFFVNLV